MNSLTYHDLQFALLRTPKQLLTIMKRPEWANKIFVGGGFLRSIVAGDPINDIDVFCPDKQTALLLAMTLNAELFDLPDSSSDEFTAEDGKKLNRIWTTDNAYTLLAFKPTIQIIHRWSFGSDRSVADSFDFTCCCAAFSWTGTDWHSVCDERFYCDVAGKRLIYRNPVRNEDAGGSMLRVLKYYQKGYRIPLDSLADVITRLVEGVDFAKLMPNIDGESSAQLAADSAPRVFSRIICGLLREVDPAIDPGHVAHLPAESTREPLGSPQ
jgi:hypothetical protein